MSPALRISFLDGMPWQTTLLTEMQMLFGKPSKPRQLGCPPWLVMNSCAASLSVKVSTPSLTSSFIKSSAPVLMTAARLMPSISAALLISLLGGRTWLLDLINFISSILASKSAWHFLYFLPLPHQHGSFLFIRRNISLNNFNIFISSRGNRAYHTSHNFFFASTILLLAQ